MVKNLPASAGDLGLIPDWGRSSGKGMATHSSSLAWRIPRDRGVWRATVHGVAKGRTHLSDKTIVKQLGTNRVGGSGVVGGARKGKQFLCWFLPLPLHASRWQFSVTDSNFVAWVGPDLGATAAAAPPWEGTMEAGPGSHGWGGAGGTAKGT